MKKLIVLLAVFTFVASAAVFAVAASNPENITLDGGKMGKVTFAHQAHQAKEGIANCTSCHHTAKADGSDAAACTSCHGEDAAAPKAKKAFHDQCKGCHKDMKKGPTKCKECHVK